MRIQAATIAAGALSAIALAAVLAASWPAIAAVEAPLRGSQGGEINAAFLSKASDGHFWAEGVINGSRIRLLVDTGASSVFLTPADAQRIGIAPGNLIYDQLVRTAGGESLAAHVRLKSLSVAGVRLMDVDALVIGRGLPSSLLGMSYLGRLSRVEATPAMLVLQR